MSASRTRWIDVQQGSIKCKGVNSNSFKVFPCLSSLNVVIASTIARNLGFSSLTDIRKFILSNAVEAYELPARNSKGLSPPLRLKEKF